jgi:hypothetical protein
MSPAGAFVELDADAWARAASALPGATAFHDHRFLALASEVLGMRFWPLALMDGGRPRALAPLLERRHGPLCTFNWVPFPYLGPLAADEDLPAVLDAIGRFARRRRAARVQLTLAGAREGAHAPLAAAGYTVAADRTLVIPTGGCAETELWSRLRKNARRDLRASAAAGFGVRPATESDVLVALPALLRDLRARGDGAGWPPGVLGTAIWRRLARSPHVRMTAVTDAAGATVAVNVALETDGRSHLWVGAAARGSVDAHAPIYWDAITNAAARGLDAVDLGGAPTPGIGAYKRKFGAIEEPVLVARRDRMPGYGVAQRAHHAMTRRADEPARA